MRSMRDIMSTDTITVSPQDSIVETAKKMRDNNIGFIPVVGNDRLEGVITDRDMVIRGFAEQKNASATVQEVMTKKLISCSPETTVDEAAKLMAQNKIRRLPVVEGNRLIGVVAIADLAVRENFDDEAGEALSQISEPQFASTK